MLESVWRDLAALNFEYVRQFAAALVPMSVTVFIHAQGMKLSGCYFKRFGTLAAIARRGSATTVLITIAAIMLATHFAEVVAWASFFLLTGMLASIPDAMTLSINSYTTLGASNIQLPGRWHGFDGFEAMSAMLMFGWSTAVLAAVVQKTHSMDS